MTAFTHPITWLPSIRRVVLALSASYFLLSAQVTGAGNTAFEYYGIKAGMTEEALRKELNLDLAASVYRSYYPALYKSNTTDEIVKEILEQGLDTSTSTRLAGNAFSRLNFYLTDQNGLPRF